MNPGDCKNDRAKVTSLVLGEECPFRSPWQVRQPYLFMQSVASVAFGATPHCQLALLALWFAYEKAIGITSEESWLMAIKKPPPPTQKKRHSSLSEQNNLAWHVLFLFSRTRPYQMPSVMLLGLVLVCANCRQIAGVDDLPDKSASGTAGSTSMDSCLADREGDALLRVGHMAGTSKSYTFCLEDSQSGHMFPLLRPRQDCKSTMNFGDLTRLISLPVGNYSIVVTSSSCEQGEARVVWNPKAGDRTTALVVESSKTGPQLVLSSESSTHSTEEVLCRLVHGMPDEGPFDFGSADSSHYPVNLTGTGVRGLAFGQELDGSQVDLPGGLIDGNYIQIISFDWTLGVAHAGEQPALAHQFLPFGSEDFGHFLIVVAGKKDDPVYPTQLVVCDETKNQGDWARCYPRWERSFLSWNTFNASKLQNPVFPEERLKKQIEVVNKEVADVLCLTELSNPSIKDTFADGVRDRFPYHAYVETNMDTKVDSPEDLNGLVPELPEFPPCHGYEETLQKLVDCLVDKCSTIPGDYNGFLTSENCVQSACLPELLPFLSDPSGLVCLSCVRALGSDFNFEYGRNWCTTHREFPLGNAGRNDPLVLSRTPLVEKELFVMPSTDARRTVLRTSVALEDNSLVDVYCNRFTSFRNGAYDVYPGLYGGGNTGPEGWAREQLVQVKKLNDFVQSRSAARGRPAVVLGWFGSTARYDRDGFQILEDLNPDTIRALEQVFLPSVVPGWEPSCTACPVLKQPEQCPGCLQNILYDDTALGVWPDRIFHQNGTTINTLRVVRTEIDYTEAIVSIPPSTSFKGQSLLPLSDSFAFRSRIAFRP
jgi:hypothetical protein